MHQSDRDVLVGIVTVTFNSAQVLPDFLSSLEKQTHARFHLWAVDNASKDTTLQQLNVWSGPRLTIIANEANEGVAGGNNQGVRAALEAGCTHVLLLNNDVYFESDLLSGLLAGLEEHRCELTVPLMYYAEPGAKVWCAGGTFRKDFALLPVHYGKDEVDSGQFTEAMPISYSPTCCTLIKREVFEHIGLMDERYFVYADDLDFMYRVLKAGLVTYFLPTVKLWHKVSSLTGEESPFSQRYMTRNRAFFIRKHLGWMTLVWFSILYRGYYFIRYLRGQDGWSTMLRKERAWSEGLRVR